MHAQVGGECEREIPQVGTPLSTECDTGFHPKNLKSCSEPKLRVRHEKLGLMKPLILRMDDYDFLGKSILGLETFLVFEEKPFMSSASAFVRNIQLWTEKTSG